MIKSLWKPICIGLCLLICMPLWAYNSELVRTAAAKESFITKQVTEMLSQGEFDSQSILVTYKSSNLRTAEKLRQRPKLLPVQAEFKLKNAVATKKRPEAKPATSQAEKSAVEAALKTALADPSVETAQPNYIYRTDWAIVGNKAKPSDFDDTRNWYYLKASLPEMWKDQGCPGNSACGGSSDVMVAVIDTGVAFEDFDDTAGFTGADFKASAEYQNRNFYVNNAEATGIEGEDDDCNGYVDDIHGADTYAGYLLEFLGPTCTGNTPEAVSGDYKKAGHPVDTYGHGTFVTGLISGEVENPGTGTNSVSPAFKTTILPLAANAHFDDFFTTISLIYALDYAGGAGADIVNMSLGGNSNDPSLQNAVNQLTAAGVLVVAASGNEGGQINYPARYSTVLSVGAVNSNNTRSGYSNYGTELDITAYVGSFPSNGNAAYQNTINCYGSCDETNVGSTPATTKYSTGTSFAAPQVAALAALIKAKRPSYTAAQLWDVIIASATDLGTSGRDDLTGYGVINYQKALNTLAPASAPVYRFWSDSYLGHFYTISEAEKNYVIANYPTNIWRYESIAYRAYPLPKADNYPVYRFWSDTYHAHFYTISQAERDEVIADYPDNIWRYESIAYYARKSSGSGAIPVYRFWSNRYLNHFFTASAFEKDYVIENYPDETWRYEGIAFYAYPQ